MKLLDAVFATGQPDEHYLRRRESTLIVGIECLKPCDEHSFCKSMNTLTANDGFDLHLTDMGDVYAVEVGTEAGAKLLQEHCQVCEASETAVAQLNQVLSEKWPNFSFRLDFDGAELPSLMALSYKDPLWDELGKRCLACGSCNIVCPTCYCFNVCDKISLDGQTGERVRLWDSCQLDELRASPPARISATSVRSASATASSAKVSTSRTCTTSWAVSAAVVAPAACLVDITPVNVWNALYQSHAS